MRYDNTKGFWSTLFKGQEHARPTRKLKRTAWENQWLNVLRVWRNTRHDDAGIERLIRLKLIWLQYATIGLYVRHFSGLCGLLARKLWVEVYVVLKLLLPLAFLLLGLTRYGCVAVISAYMTLETVIYLASLIFLSDEFSEPISSRRSLSTLLINYVQVSLDYAVIYSYSSHANPDFLKEPLDSTIKAIYFSFVTSATVGYGDIYPCTGFGQFLVVSQIVLFLVFVALFINFFSSKLQTNYHITNPKKRTKHWMPQRRKKRYEIKVTITDNK
ncbi:potassium channel family protein [Hymenobacter baengnokdamensis]|uniref:potassium channel family protein n=1 Tax=Hymenobacter baengnokdamensis TaxID=2615203 RepID=UPI001244992A|nr:potassium channel family protein [Hymenobacter baengnokdamensis]